MPDGEALTVAKCRTCGRQLTITEFKACSGVGHYCADHLAAVKSPARTRVSRPSTPSTPSKPGTSRRGRRISETGAIEYSCKGQFARNGVTRAGKLSTEHPSCLAGGAVFVCNDVGYGPGEIVTLFIKDPEGRSLAERNGYHCHG